MLLASMIGLAVVAIATWVRTQRRGHQSRKERWNERLTWVAGHEPQFCAIHPVSCPASGLVVEAARSLDPFGPLVPDRNSTRLNSSHWE